MTPKDWAREMARGLLSLARRGPRTVLWTENYHMGLGNLLYLWLWADARRAAGEDVAVLSRPTMDPWLPHFPAMLGLTIPHRAVRWNDRRVVDSPQVFGTNFLRDQLTAFIRRRVQTAPSFSTFSPDDVDPHRVVVNIRRGDYYSNPKFRGIYGFDIETYMRVAMAKVANEGPVSGVHVVSDGIDWCRSRLAWLGEFAPLSFADNETPMQNFATVATARRLILTNSTFSYWGGYISNVLHEDNFAEIYAPWFHARTIAHGMAYQLDPRWTVIEDIPGGWDS